MTRVFSSTLVFITFVAMGSWLAFIPVFPRVQKARSRRPRAGGILHFLSSQTLIDMKLNQFPFFSFSEIRLGGKILNEISLNFFYPHFLRLIEPK